MLIKGLPGVRRLVVLREDWPDALRMVISTVLAATVSSLLHLPEMYWAVLSAVIVSRPGAGTSQAAGASRLIGTVFGSAVAMGVIAARVWHVPEIALLAVAMVPLSLFITAFEEFRTAPVAAVILLSSTSALISPFHVALLRLLQITIGSLATTLVGLSVLPSRGHGLVFRMAASILRRIGATLVEDPGKLDAAHDDIRRDLRELGTLIKTKRGITRAQGRTVRLLSRLQQDSMFVGRVGVSRPGAAEYARALHGVCGNVADALLDSDPQVLARCQDALTQATAKFSGQITQPADALDFLLETLGKDLHDLIRVLQASSQS